MISESPSRKDQTRGSQAGEGREPYLSVIVASRNDDHGGDMSRRMQSTLRSVLDQLEGAKLQSELVLVDYNPPPDRPLLKDAIGWPGQASYCTVRTLVVPSQVHSQIVSDARWSFHTCVAPNVGLRMAPGRSRVEPSL